MLKVIELQIEDALSGDTGVWEVAWVEYPAIEEELMYFGRQKFYRAPVNVSKIACQAIKENEKRDNKAATQVGKIRAQQLCKRETISLETINRMKSYLERAKVYNTDDWDDKGTISWKLWGGREGLEWVDTILSTIKEDMAEVGERGGIVESDKAPKSNTPNKDPKGEGTAKGKATDTRSADVSKEVEEILKNKSDDFNERYKDKLGYGVNVGMLKSVYQRGVGAYNTSHSPAVKSSQQWALARVNAFLYIVKEGRPENKKYTGDYDLLPSGHPKKNEKFVKPNPGESKDEYIGRCIPYVLNEGASQEQAAGKCYGMWDNRDYFDYDISALPAYDNYPKSGDTDAMLVKPFLGEVEDCGCMASNNELDVFGYNTKYFYICPGATATFTDLINNSSSYPDDTFGMIRSAAVIADAVFKIEKDVLDSEVSTEAQVKEATMLVDDFKDIMVEITKLTGKDYDVSYMDNHIKTISSYLNREQFNLIGYIDGEPIFSTQQEAEAHAVNKGCVGSHEHRDSDGNLSYMACETHPTDLTTIVAKDYIIKSIGGQENIDVIFSKDYTDDEKEAMVLLTHLQRTDLEKFEAVVGNLRGATIEQVKRRNHKTATPYYLYKRVLTGEPNRDFCMSIEGRYFRRFEIDLLDGLNTQFGHNQQAYSKWNYKGGPNCIHAFYRVLAVGSNITELGPEPGLPGTPPMNMVGQGYYPGTPRYNANLSKDNFEFDLIGDLTPLGYVSGLPIYDDELIAADASYAIGCGGIYESVMFEGKQRFQACSYKAQKKEKGDALFRAVIEKKMIYTPLMVPNILIPRLDDITGERYFVKFSPETIEKIQQKFMIEQRLRDTNYEHTDMKFQDLVMVESWIVDGTSDKSYSLGYTQQQIPKGTWMAGYKVLDTDEGNDVWNKYIKTGKVKGASVEGNFILNFSRSNNDDYLLEQIINILKEIN